MDINASINSLAEQLKVPAEEVYGMLIKQAATEGISNIVMTVLFTTVLFISVKMAYKITVVKSDKYKGLEGILTPIIIIAGIYTLISIFNIPVTLSALMNPEYWALQNILNVIT